MFGKLVVIDLRECDGKLIRNPSSIRNFLKQLCKAIDMNSYGSPIVKRFGNGKFEGYSGIQFIETSSITIHCDEDKNRVFIDIFSCKDFDLIKAKEFSKKYFEAEDAQLKEIIRK